MAWQWLIKGGESVAGQVTLEAWTCDFRDARGGVPPSVPVHCTACVVLRQRNRQANWGANTETDLLFAAINVYGLESHTPHSTCAADVDRLVVVNPWDVQLVAGGAKGSEHRHTKHLLTRLRISLDGGRRGGVEAGENELLLYSTGDVGEGVE